MAAVGLHVTGIDELRTALERMAARVNAAAPAAVGMATEMVEAAAMANLSRYSHPPGTPTPSPPGHPPARVTGRLRGSFEIAGPTPQGRAVWRAVVGPTAVYARIQELGGVAGNGAVLPARPYLRPTVETLAHSHALQGVFVNAWETAIFG